MMVGRGKGRLEWGKQHLLTVGTELESLSMHSVGSLDSSGLDGPKVATEQYIFSCQTSGNLRECMVSLWCLR